MESARFSPEAEIRHQLGPWPPVIVAFTDTDKPQWWDKFTRPGFRHCFTLSYDPYIHNHILIDWCMSGLETTVVDTGTWPAIMGHLKAMNGTLVGTGLLGHQTLGPMYFFPANCVTLTKHTLRIKRRNIWTPYALYEYILKCGGREMISWRQS